ncbi:WYL domain-containing protein [Aquitalea pelogenes]|uniref:WYL domain-containing protein n=1 Tax=Aquitalea pelogenes TaxID=1293573 RepID=UPI0009EC8607|nr:WYL domain-containing protein [Aquitalea pelogenes]
MEQLIKDAIATKKIIQFSYGGHCRVIEPHILGVSKGVVQVLGYQLDGSSASGAVPDWRRFDLSRISALQITAQTFPGPRPFPSGKHSSWDYEITIVT